MHWVKICAEGKLSRGWWWWFCRSEAYKWSAECLVCFLHPLPIALNEHVGFNNHESETVGESLSSAAVCSLGRLLLLQGHLPTQGHLRATLVPPCLLCGLSQGRCSGPVLGQHVRSRRGFLLAWPLGKDLASLEEQPTLLLCYSPLANLHLAFYCMLDRGAYACSWWTSRRVR